MNQKNKLYELVSKIIKFNPIKYKENTNTYVIIYDNIMFKFWAMDNDYPLMSINDESAMVINKETKKIVLDYFETNVNIDDLLNSVNNKIRSKKLKNLQ